MRRAHCWPSRNQKLSVSAFSSRELPRDSRSAEAFFAGALPSWLRRREKRHHRMAMGRESARANSTPRGRTRRTRRRCHSHRRHGARQGAQERYTHDSNRHGAFGDPVRTGLVDSLARPGANLAGFSDFMPALTAKRLEILKELVPQATRVVMMLNQTNPTLRWSSTRPARPQRPWGLN